MRRAALVILAAALAGLSPALAFAAEASPAPSATPSPAPTATPAPTPSATPSPVPSAGSQPSPGAGPAATPRTPPPPDPAAYERLRTRLGGSLAATVAAQEQLGRELAQAGVRQRALEAQVDESSARLGQLSAEVARLDAGIGETQARIRAERALVAAMAQAMYRQPDSVLLRLAGSRSAGEALAAGTDLVIGGQRAHALETRLRRDLTRLESDRAARQAAIRREEAARRALEASLTTLIQGAAHQEQIAEQLGDLVDQVRDAIAGLPGMAPEVAASLTRLLEQHQRNLSQAARQHAWTRARAGAGRVQALGELPAGQALAGLRLGSPLPGSSVTQPFGPSELWFEPPLGGYARFHTGVDLAAPSGTPVLAAADGVVVSAVSSRLGYGNHVVVAHGQDLFTLYAHLQALSVTAGDAVVQGQELGLEGSTGLSTGPHLHFELRVKDQVVDPLPYIAGGEVTPPGGGAG